ncbi:MAG TPA: heliorhodopsin HeR [Ilumatobacter sp.]
MSTSADPTSVDPTSAPVVDRLARLRRWNVGVGVAHLAQGVLILLLGNGFAIAVGAPVQDGPPGTPLTIEHVFFDLRFSVAIAVFLFLAAADHLLMAAPGVVGWYEANLRRGINVARWIEYSVSASLMVVLIAMLPGITNLYALIGLFAVNAAMIAFGWLMERTNRPGDPVDWWPFTLGGLAGIVPWIVIAIALITSQREGDGVPGFVYGIFVSLFVLFNCFALNQWLQYRGRGRFADYLYGEQVYLVLSLAAKSALAWQVFAGTLAD